MSGDRVNVKKMLDDQLKYWANHPGQAFDEGAYLADKKSHQLVASGWFVGGLCRLLVSRPDLFGEHPERGHAYIHSQMTDIWVRYNDIAPYLAKGDLRGFNDMHYPIWYPAYREMQNELSPLIHRLMWVVRGEHLGAVLITKLPPGKKILPHIDTGWHAEYYDKYFIPLQNDPGCVFGFADGDIIARPGEVWKFDNSILHWVNNDSDRDRIALIVCIRSDKGG